MNRREFLKLAVKVATVAAAPKAALAFQAEEVAELQNRRTPAETDGYLFSDDLSDKLREWAQFNPAWKYGNIVDFPKKNPTPKDKLVVIQALEEDMKKFIPPGYRHKVTYLERPTGDYGRPGIAWYYNPD